MATEEHDAPPQQQGQNEMERCAALIEEVLGVELLEYHNSNWLAQGPKQRGQAKRALLCEALLCTGCRTDICEFV